VRAEKAGGHFEHFVLVHLTPNICIRRRNHRRSHNGAGRCCRVKPNTHRRHRRDATVELRRVEVLTRRAVCIEFATS